jgi:hypothetical protein
MFTTANVTDRAGALEAFDLAGDMLSGVVSSADGGYSGETSHKLQEKLGCGVEIAKRSELHTLLSRNDGLLNDPLPGWKMP